MNEGPNIVNIAALVGDHARSSMLTALMTGEALTATELAAEANVTKQTASSHLAKMKAAGLIEVASQGRNRYFRIAAPDVAQLLENLMGIAQRTGATRIRPGPRDPELRKARVCYDHLAGDIGVRIYEAFHKHGFVRQTCSNGNMDITIELTKNGRQFCSDIKIDLVEKSSSRRPTCRPCLDWSVRRFHLAGTLGVGILNYCYHHKLAKRIEGTRIVRFTPRGESTLTDIFQLNL